MNLSKGPIAIIHIPHSPLNSIYYALTANITQNHYLHKMPDPRTSKEVYGVFLPLIAEPVGCFVFGRPQANRCKDWYGSVEDLFHGRCECTRWQVLNLSRVWIDPHYQKEGSQYHPSILKGFIDRKGIFRSTLASEAINAACQVIGFDYLLQRPPVYLDEPYEIKWLMSYCNTNLHKGTIYKSAGFELYRTNQDGVQTWRKLLPALSPDQNMEIMTASIRDWRAKKYRAKRSQLVLQFQ
jgi:hypothetical protein